MSTQPDEGPNQQWPILNNNNNNNTTTTTTTTATTATPTTAPASSRSPAEPYPGDEAATIRNRHQIVEFSTQAQRLLQLEPIREPVRRKASFEVNLDRMPNLESALAQIVGRVNRTPCDSCSRGSGPFGLCVSVDGMLRGSCANCHYNSLGRRCSFRRDASATNPGATPQQPRQHQHQQHQQQHRQTHPQNDTRPIHPIANQHHHPFDDEDNHDEVDHRLNLLLDNDNDNDNDNQQLPRVFDAEPETPTANTNNINNARDNNLDLSLYDGAGPGPGSAAQDRSSLLARPLRSTSRQSGHRVAKRACRNLRIVANQSNDTARIALGLFENAPMEYGKESAITAVRSLKSTLDWALVEISELTRELAK